MQNIVKFTCLFWRHVYQDLWLKEIIKRDEESTWCFEGIKLQPSDLKLITYLSFNSRGIRNTGFKLDKEKNMYYIFISLNKYKDKIIIIFYYLPTPKTRE